MGPRFSVVLPVNEGALDVGRALVSVLAQTFGDLEVLVLPMQCGEDSLEPVRLLADERVMIVEPGDPSLAMIEVLSECQGTQVSVLDENTSVKPNWLAQCGRALDRTDRRSLLCAGTQHGSDGGAWEISLRPGAVRPGSFLMPPRVLIALSESGPCPNGAEELSSRISHSDAIGGAAHVEHNLVDWHEPVAHDHAEGDRQRLNWIHQALDSLTDSPIPDVRLLARYATIGGVAAVRLDMHSEARRLFGLARSAQPGEFKPIMRWAASWVPGVASLCWSDQS